MLFTDNKIKKIMKKYKFVFESLENYDKTGKLIIDGKIIDTEKCEQKYLEEVKRKARQANISDN